MTVEYKARSARVWAQDYRLTRYAQSVEFGRKVDTIDCDVIESIDKMYLAGMRSGTLSLSGLANAYTSAATSTATLSTGAVRPAWQNGLERALGSTAEQVWTVAMLGDVIGGRAWLMPVIGTELSWSAPATDVVGVAIAAAPSTRPRAGRIHLRGTVPVTGTTAMAAVDHGAASTSGCIVHYHLTDVSTSTGSTVASFKVVMQHSSANVSWADIAGTSSTFAGPGQTWKGHARKTTTGLVKRYTRANVATFTGGAGKSVAIAVAMARSTQ